MLKPTGANLTDIISLCGKKPNLLIIVSNNMSVNSHYYSIISKL